MEYSSTPKSQKRTPKLVVGVFLLEKRFNQNQPLLKTKQTGINPRFLGSFEKPHLFPLAPPSAGALLLPAGAPGPPPPSTEKFGWGPAEAGRRPSFGRVFFGRVFFGHVSVGLRSWP